jgi:hypothetical protein
MGVASLPRALSLWQGQRSVSQLSAVIMFAGLLTVFQFCNII